MQTNETRIMKSVNHIIRKTIPSVCFKSLAFVLLFSTLRAEIPRVQLKPFADGFTSPIALTPLNDGKGTLIVADQVGVAHLLTTTGMMRGQPFLSLSHRLTKLNLGFEERGLLGIVAHPDFKNNGKIYVYYSAPLRKSAPKDWNHTTRIAEFKTVEGDSETIDLASERILIEYDEPYFNHNGGALAFGPSDGFLYIASGDGGNANGRGRGHSEIGNSQDLTNLLGKILRIDVNQGEPYTIPRDNPFQSKGWRGEIFAIGFRNPWRISFDRGGNHSLFAADIGQNLYEEVNVVHKGGNYGWNVREGFHCFDPENPTKTPENCAENDHRGHAFVDPIVEYKNIKAFKNQSDAFGISITGGYIYRGKAIQGLQGYYVFADWSRNWAIPDGVILAAKPDEGDGPWKIQSLPTFENQDGHVGRYITAFGEDRKGELYVLTNASNGLMNRKGGVFKMVAP
jgi:glucose/arabinose dehydrogenase